MVFKTRTLALPQPRSDQDLLAIHGRLRRFSLPELLLATDNFSTNNVVGRGAFGNVYQGRLPDDGSLVAVKRLGRNLRNHPGSELHFQTELSFGQGTIRNHRNLIRALGFCVTRRERILVYPFLAHGSLASRLRGSPPSLDWPKRKRIALGIAEGLAHLHHGSDFKLVHRDLKADNVLLDADFEPAIADFGLVVIVDRNSGQRLLSPLQNVFMDGEEDDSEEESSSDEHTNVSCVTKLKSLTRTIKKEVKSKSSSLSGSYLFKKKSNQFYNHDFTEVSTAVRGTIGYIAPEYLSTGKCSVKCDVFGYGIVLLELISGRKGYDRARARRGDQQYILNWAKGVVREERLEELADPNLRGCYAERELEQLVEVALLCTTDSPTLRPEMSQVIEMVGAIGRHKAERLGSTQIETFSIEARVVTEAERPCQAIGKPPRAEAALLSLLQKCRFDHVVWFLFTSVCINCILVSSLLSKWGYR